MLAADAGDANPLYEEAVALSRAAGDPWHLAIALAEAASILERLGAAPALERLAAPALRDSAQAAG